MAETLPLQPRGAVLSSQAAYTSNRPAPSTIRAGGLSQQQMSCCPITTFRFCGWNIMEILNAANDTDLDWEAMDGSILKIP